MNAVHCDVYSEESHALTRILWAEAEQVSFSGEDTERILGPLRSRIIAGEFSRPLRRGHILRLAAALAAAFVLTAAIAQSQLSDPLIFIADDIIPLTGDFPAGGNMSGSVIMEGSGAEGIRLTLVSAGSSELIQATVTRADGSFEFSGLPLGTYRIKIDLPPELALARDMGNGDWVSVSGKRDFVIDTENNEWEGLAIQICRSLD